MKKVIFDEYGGLDVLKVIDADVPKPQDSEILIKVKVAGLNPGEISIREGYLENMFHTDFPSGEGTDFAGVVTEVGSAVEKFKVGDEVLGYTHGRASHSEYVAVSQDNIITKPDTVSWQVAGSLFVAGTTAYAGVQSVDVKAGDMVVVSGAAGGVGIIAAQLAVLKGAKVIGIASRNYHDWLTKHGITPVDYHDDVTTKINSIADKIDAFIDTVGHGYVEMAIDKLGVDKDRVNTCIDFEAAAKYGVKTHGSDAAKDIKVVEELVNFIDEGKLEIPIAKSFEIDQVQDAYKYLADNHDLGKVIFIFN